MFGVIYKITCKENGKVYIGQTVRPMLERFERHFRDAEAVANPWIHFQRALKKYGRNAFYIEKIDEANSREELNEKEKYWIKKYNSIANGYNTAEGGNGGNTYSGRNTSEMETTRKKISKALKGRNNGLSKQVKCKSIKTGEEHFFESLTDCLSFLGVKNKSIVMLRCNKKDNSLWRHEWMFAFENDDYGEYIDKQFTLSSRRGTKVTLTKGTEVKTFPSKAMALNFLGYSYRQSGAIAEGMTINGWTISF